jgi:chromosome segregation ATPase
MALATTAASAQTQRSGGGADARAAQQMQQLAAERAALQAENAQLKKQLEEAKRGLEEANAQLASTGAKQAALEQRARASEATAARLSAGETARAAELERTRSQLNELVAKYRQTAQSLREIETDGESLRQQLGRSQRSLADCAETNSRLIAMNEEVLVRLENTGFWTRAAAAEPFTRLKRTQLENLADEQRTLARELAVAAPEPATSPAPDGGVADDPGGPDPGGPRDP